MKLILLTAIIAASLPCTLVGQGFTGSVEFTAAEKAAHQRDIGTITQIARRYLEDIYRDHLAFHRRYGVSKYYGDRSTLLNTRAKRIAALQQAGAPVALVDQLVPTSCIGLSLNALAAGFRAPGDANLESALQKIQRFARANDLDGSAVLHALQKLGWKICFWNPTPRDNARWDAEEANWASKGWHAYRYSTVMNRGTYYYNRVDDKSLLVGFGTQVPSAFKSAPFFIGVAHTGYHVFPGFQGTVIEAHSTRALSSVNNLETSPFNPLGPGGGPRWTPREKYRSGLDRPATSLNHSLCVSPDLRPRSRLACPLPAPILHICTDRPLPALPLCLGSIAFFRVMCSAISVSLAYFIEIPAFTRVLPLVEAAGCVRWTCSHLHLIRHSGDLLHALAVLQGMAISDVMTDLCPIRMFGR